MALTAPLVKTQVKVVRNGPTQELIDEILGSPPQPKLLGRLHSQIPSETFGLSLITTVIYTVPACINRTVSRGSEYGGAFGTSLALWSNEWLSPITMGRQ